MLERCECSVISGWLKTKASAFYRVQLSTEKLYEETVCMSVFACGQRIVDRCDS